MRDAGLSNSPTPAPAYDASDVELSAELKKWTGTTPALHPVGELLDRHWEAAFAYARLCTSGPRPAGMLTTAAFTRLFGESLRQSGPTSAWRPQLLVTVRRLAAEWEGDHRHEMLHPELRSTTGGGNRVAARLLPAPDRRLLSRAFQNLPQSARCLLWHAEVEAEPLEIPAGLLGLSVTDAAVELGRARGRLREECLHVHREVVQQEECRRYIRLIDVTCRRRSFDIDPDLAKHLADCKPCRYAADQLNQFNGDLALALAEGVLGWGARAYLESRPGRAAESAIVEVDQVPVVEIATVESVLPVPRVLAQAPPMPVNPPTTTALAVHPGSHRSAHKAARRAVRRRNRVLAAATVSALVLVPLVLWTALGSDDDEGQTAGTSPSDTATDASGTSDGDPSWVGSGETTKGALRGRLHNVDSKLCIGIVGGKAVEGAETELTTCSAATGQEWTYETDGLLRNAAAPDLCLDSHLGYSVQLAPCTGVSQPGTKNVRYDFTLQGTLVPRWDQELALTPATARGEAPLVLKPRAEAPDQHWVFDSSAPSLQMEAVNWDAATESDPPVVKKSPAPSTTPTPTPTPAEPTPTPTAATPTPTASNPQNMPCNPYGPYPCGPGPYGNPYGGGYGYGYGGYGGWGTR
ncbi:ricin-type beta-trefoil lectin domain protein [Streptomyces sp. WI04-05B]|uniref:ricin-type beta-trefoil lectin domain protein n=1 Tax=Streptomyces TaxID=1883 RepID=UPI0029B3CFAC|nr:MULTISPECIES: ricin-type beta-trefoil lectin domain protein [unclassified Streptomyces]MDX2545944.1 ricin-type beta-trefoil lectin domain protein [Streptomyces sp. WI04-05B]MDX2582755.1 ricin-type beta-trefoil lectin domain protein [Streptomyces sp. WI04-05A]MDX3746930.1 ricin-type beta-trefoil lectin domain protein [Streptomyces sp. AK08-02]